MTVYGCLIKKGLKSRMINALVRILCLVKAKFKGKRVIPFFFKKVFLLFPTLGLMKKFKSGKIYMIPITITLEKSCEIG